MTHIERLKVLLFAFNYQTNLSFMAAADSKCLNFDQWVHQE